MSTLPLLVCAVLAASPDGGVPPAARTPAAQDPHARLVVAQGQVSGRTGAGVPFAAALGTDFDPADTVVVAPGAWAALVLRNKHVVRLDDDLELRVSELALFRAPPSTLGVGDQLNRLLTEKERSAVQAERLIGWHADLVAANTPGGTRLEPSVPPPAQGSSRKKVAPGAKNAEIGRASAISGEGVALPSAPRRTPASPAADASEPAERSRGRPPASPAPTLQADEALRSCIAQDAVAPYQAVLGDVLELVLEVRALEKAEPFVRFKNGLPVPPCARAWVASQPGRFPAGQRVTIAVPIAR